MVNIIVRGHVCKCNLSFSKALDGPTGSSQRGATGHLMWPFYVCADMAHTTHRDLCFLKIITSWKLNWFGYTVLMIAMSLQHLDVL